MKKKLFALFGALSLAPVAVFAAVTTNSNAAGCNIDSGSNLFDLICRIGQLLNAVVPVLIALGVVYFVFGVITYVVADDEEAKQKGRNRIILGIIGLAVIIGLWGLVNLLRNTFGLSNTTQIELPTINPDINSQH